MSSEKEPTVTVTTPTEIPLNYRILGRIPSIVAQHMMVQGIQELVVLSFFETVLPTKAEITQEDLDELAKTGVLAECVGRVTMPPSAFLQAADAMQRVAEVIRKNIKETGNKDATIQGN